MAGSALGTPAGANKSFAVTGLPRVLAMGAAGTYEVFIVAETADVMSGVVRAGNLQITATDTTPPTGMIGTVTLTDVGGSTPGVHEDTASIELVSITGSPDRAYWAIFGVDEMSQPTTVDAVKMNNGTITINDDMDSIHGVRDDIRSGATTHTIDISDSTISTGGFNNVSTLNIYVVLTKTIGDPDVAAGVTETDDIDSILLVELDVTVDR